MFSILYYIFLTMLCATFLTISTVALAITYPFQKSRYIVHMLTRIQVRIFFFIPPMWRHKVIGMENIDRKKTYVIVINHQAMTDIPSLYFLPINFCWVSKREVFRIPLFGQFLSVHGDICINRGHATAALEQLLRDGKMWINRGASIAIFPEGTRSKDGDIKRFKSGAFNLAHDAQVEILPVLIEGTSNMVMKNRAFNWRNKITIKVLPPIPVERVVNTDPKEMALEINAQMRDAQIALRKELYN